MAGHAARFRAQAAHLCPRGEDYGVHIDDDVIVASLAFDDCANGGCRINNAGCRTVGAGEVLKAWRAVAFSASDGDFFRIIFVPMNEGFSGYVCMGRCNPLFFKRNNRYGRNRCFWLNHNFDHTGHLDWYFNFSCYLNFGSWDLHHASNLDGCLATSSQSDDEHEKKYSHYVKTFIRVKHRKPPLLSILTMLNGSSSKTYKSAWMLL